MTVNVIHVYAAPNDARALLRGTYGFYRWFAGHGFRGYRLRGGLQVKVGDLPDIRAAAQLDGWMVREHDATPR